MTSAQKENLLRLHRLAAYGELAHQSLVAIGGTAEEVANSRREWEAAETDLASYREYLAMLHAHEKGHDGGES